MITIHASAVCRVRDGFTGRGMESAGLLCTLDGISCRPVWKPGGYLVLTNLPHGPHRLRLRGRGYQEEWVELDVDGGTRELDITMKPGPDHPLRGSMTWLTLEVTEGKVPAAGRQLWLAVPAGPEIKIAQTKAEVGDTQTRLFCKGSISPTVPGSYLISDGADSEIVSLRSLEGETGTLAAPLLRSHGRGRLLLPAQSYHTDARGNLTAAFSGPCAVEICGPEGDPLGRLELQNGENRQWIQWKKERHHGKSSG